jgi:frataxin
MNDTDYENLSDSLLATLEEALADNADCDLQGSVLTIEGNGGTWVINKHLPSRQIWLSSPHSGARHYAFEPESGLWRDTRDGADLLATLNAELGSSVRWWPQ